jgi:glycosyltransferase involved in cell wall biosynthesis
MGGLKPKILMISSGLNVSGGLERMVVKLANLLSENEYRVSLLILSDTVDSFYPIDEKVNISSLNVDFGINTYHRYLRRKYDFLADSFKLRNKVLESGADWIIASEYVQSATLVFTQLHKKFRIISWPHENYYRKGVLWKKLSDHAYRKVCAIVCLSKDEEKIYKKLNMHTYVITNFIDIPAISSSLEKRNILTIARLNGDKGIDYLMAIAGIVLKKNPGWTWYLIGTGPLQDDVLKFIDREKLADSFRLITPNSYSLEKVYQETSIYVMTSRLERLPMVLIEAMSCGVPAIAFDCESGPRHIITEGENGFLIMPFHIKKMADAISVLIQDHQLRKKMGDNAKRNSYRFSTDVALKKWEELFACLSQSSNFNTAKKAS